MEKYEYIILLICTLLCIKAEDTFKQCKSTNNCICTSSPLYSQYEFHCPEDSSSIIITVKPGSQSVEIDCMEKIDWNIQNLPSVGLGALKIFQIKDCPPPKDNFSDLMSKLGINSTNIFKFTNSDYMNGLILTSRMLEGAENVQKLVLDTNNLEYIDKDAFLLLTELIQLEIKYNKINLEQNLFSPLTKLKSLDLTGNELTSLPYGIFENLTALEDLSLRYNNLSYIDSNSFNNLVNLNLLELSCNKLENISEDALYDLENLKKLSLSGNKLQYLPEKLFKKSKSLVNIYLYRNQDLILPNGLFSNLSELQNIELNECGITSLPNKLFAGSVNIKKIVLRMNQIEKLPEYIFEDLKELEDLDLSINKLKELPEKLFSVNSNLKKLNIADNLLTRITRNLFKNLHKLEQLNLENNQISVIDTYAFGGMTSLKEIILANNYIDFNDQVLAPFSLNTNLEKINLSHNNITSITADVAQSLTILNELDLSYNQISHIQFSDMLTSSPFATIDLSHNKITIIDFKNAIEENEEVNLNKDPTIDGKRTVSLEENPITCNCQIYDFIVFMNLIKSHEITSMVTVNVNDVNCTLPNKSKMPIKNVELDMLTCSLEELGIKEEIAENCRSYEFRPWDKSLIIDCKDSNLTKVPLLNISNSYQYHQIEVHLEGNQLTTGPTKGMGYENITKLCLFSNDINEISWIPPNIKVLELHNNNITSIDSNILSSLNASSFTNITLGNNPWNCDCSIANLTSFLTSSNIAHKQIDVNNITCKDNGKHVISLETEEICPNTKVWTLIWTICILLFLITICVFCVAYCTFKQEIKVWLFAHNMFLWFVHEEELDRDKKYDAFISYSHQDEEFVIKQLQPVLEEGTNPYKLCLHIRDFIAGEFISKQIVDSVSSSKRTIVIMSRNFLASEWGKMEFRIAHKQALQEGRARVILILYGEIDLNSELDDEFKAYIKTNTYVKWGDPWFWNKLRYALPHLKCREPRKRRNIMLAIRRSISRFGDKVNLIHSAPATPIPASTPPVLSLDPLLLKKNPLDFTPAGV